MRTSCDGDALIALRLDVFPLVDEAADVLDLLLALPWLPPTALFPHIRNRLMEDLLVDLCDIEGSESYVARRPFVSSKCAASGATRTPPPRRVDGVHLPPRPRHRCVDGVTVRREHDCATEMDEAGGERPMVRRKTSSEPVAGQKRKK